VVPIRTSRGGEREQYVTLTAATEVMPAGTHSVGVDCIESAQYPMNVPLARVTAVGLSSG
jgi:hypothetical protein